MKLIVGLGNPGEQYIGTRHNTGFMVLDQLLKDTQTVKQSNWSINDKLKSEIVILDWQRKNGPAEKVILARPQTYMNNSGMAVKLVADYYKVSPEDTWIIYDELDLPLGKIKIRNGGAAAGHHGVEDIIEKLGTDKFWRFRLGIGQIKHSSKHLTEDGKEEQTIVRRDMGNTNNFVLGEFSGKEKTEVKKLVKYCMKAVEVALEKDMTAAMNQFNTN